MAAPDNEVYVFPLSFAQERLWFLSLLEPDSAAYNVVRAFRIAGALDESVYVEKIRAAGFENVEIVSRRYSRIGQNYDSSQELTKKVASIRVKASKPA